jgi:hypothetical protein
VLFSCETTQNAEDVLGKAKKYDAAAGVYVEMKESEENLERRAEMLVNAAEKYGEYESFIATAAWMYRKAAAAAGIYSKVAVKMDGKEKKAMLAKARLRRCTKNLKIS